MAATADLKDAVKSRLEGEAGLELVRSHLQGLRRSGGEYKCICPFHDDHNPSMGINTRKGIFKCFSCGWSGDAIKVLGELHGITNFRDQLVLCAERMGIPTDRRVDAALVKPKPRERLVDDQSCPIMRPLDILEHEEKLRERQIDPTDMMKVLYKEHHAAAVIAMEMLGGFITSGLSWYPHPVMVVPMRRADGTLCSLRLRMMDGPRRGKRISLDEKEKRGDEWVQVKRTESGLMAAPDFFDPNIDLSGCRTMVVEGETDLIAGMAMCIESYGVANDEDSIVVWPARWCGLPGVNTCHAMLCETRLSPWTTCLFDNDEAAKLALFDQRQMRRNPETSELEPIEGVERRPKLMSMLMATGRTKPSYSFPPDMHSDSRRKGKRKKSDLRDLLNAGWTWTMLRKHILLRSGTNLFQLFNNRELYVETREEQQAEADHAGHDET